MEFESHHKKGGLTYYWDAPDVTGQQFENWEKAWEYLKYVIHSAKTSYCGLICIVTTSEDA